MIEAFPFLYHLCAGALVLIGVLILCCLVYGVRGRRFTDRVVAVNVVGTLTISAICILSFALQESYIAAELPGGAGALPGGHPAGQGPSASSEREA